MDFFCFGFFGIFRFFEDVDFLWKDKKTKNPQIPKHQKTTQPKNKIQKIQKDQICFCNRKIRKKKSQDHKKTKIKSKKFKKLDSAKNDKESKTPSTSKNYIYIYI